MLIKLWESLQRDKRDLHFFKFEKQITFVTVTVILAIQDLIPGWYRFFLEERLIAPVIANAALYRKDSYLFRKDSLNGQL